MNLRLFCQLTWLFLTNMDYCRGLGTNIKFTGFGLSKNVSILEGDVLAECGTKWYKVCSINGLFNTITDINDIRHMVCNDYYRFLYTHIQNDYDTITLVTENVSQNVAVFEQQSCEVIITPCVPMNLRCPGLQPGAPTIRFGEFNVTHPTQVSDLKEGDTVQMTCIVYGGIPKPTFTWQARTTSNIETGSTKWYMDTATTNDVAGLFYQTVRVNLTRENDQDIYKCNVTLDGISQYAQEQLLVRFSPIISVLDIQTVQAFTPVNIQCTVHSNPESNTKLLKPTGQEIQHHQQIVNEEDPYNMTYIFHIGLVTSSDFGKYTCLARNTIGGVGQERNKTTMLFIESAPIIYVPDSKTVQESASITIQCTVHCYPVSDTKLLKPDGQEIHPQGYVWNEPNNITYIFNIGEVTSFDLGKYTCLANNTIGGVDQERSKTTMLFIEFAPVISVRDSQTAQESATVTITCSVYSNPVSDTRVLKPDGQEINPQEQIPNENEEEDPYNITYSFNIGVVKPSDWGQYTCLAMNTIGGVDQERNKTTMLFIEFAPIINVIDNQKVQEPAQVTIQCTVHCYPVSDAKLLKPNGQVLEQHEKLPNEENPYNITYSFNIGVVTPSDLGNYTCLVRNTIAGVDQDRNKTTMLFIEFAPIISILDVHSVQESASATIQCTVYCYPVPNTRLLNPDGQDIPIHHVQLPSVKNPYNITYSFYIGNVTRSDLGKYTCLAKNTIGGVDQGRHKTTNLVIEYAPIINLPDIYKIAEFTNVEMRCGVKSFPQAATTWYDKNNKKLFSHTQMIKTSTGEIVLTTAVLRFPNVTRGDGGEYTCRAENVVNDRQQVESAKTTLYVRVKTKNCKAIIREKKTCICNKRRTHIKPQQNLTDEVLMEVMEETKNQLTRDRTSLSSYTSTKVSATDNRPSSISLGFLGIVVITMAVAFIVSGDVMHGVIKLRMKLVQDNIPVIEKGQVEVPESNEDGEGTAIIDEKPATSCDYNNEFKPLNPCSLNDNDSFTSQSSKTSGAKVGKQTKENETTSTTTATDIETESKSSDIGETFVAPADRNNRTSDVANGPIVQSDNAEKAESVAELAVGTYKDKRAETLPSAVVTPFVQDKIEGAATGTKVKKIAGKSGVQKSNDKPLPYMLTAYKRSKGKPSSLTSNSRKSKVSPFTSGIKGSKITKEIPASKGMASNTAKGKQSTSTGMASKTTWGKQPTGMASKTT